MQKVELILLTTEEEYRKEYIKVFIDCKYFLGDIPVLFDEKSFDHIFYEPAKNDNGKVFSKRRAKRMMFIKKILSNDLDIEIMYQPDRGTFAVFCLELECVVYLRRRIGTNGLQIGTFFDFGNEHTRMYRKQKKKCLSITLQEIKQKII